jgi:hypothetical protein
MELIRGFNTGNYIVPCTTAALSRAHFGARLRDVHFRAGLYKSPVFSTFPL